VYTCPAGEADAQGGGDAASDPLTASESTEDGAAYLSSVKAAQQELDKAGGTARARPVSTSAAPAAAWPGPTTGCSKLAAMKAATQAALAAIGRSENSSAAVAVDSTADACVAAAPEAEAGAGAAERQPSGTDGSRDGAPEPGSFDLGLVNSWSSGTTQGPASDGHGDGSSSPATAEKSGAAVGQACAAEDVVVQVPCGAAVSGLYDLD
jgi:hypothetical protein